MTGAKKEVQLNMWVIKVRLYCSRVFFQSPTFLFQFLAGGIVVEGYRPASEVDATTMQNWRFVLMIPMF